MPGINYTLGMKTAGFDSGISGALSKVTGMYGKIAALVTGAVAGAGIAGIVAKSIGKAADMETMETAFIPILGGIKEAKARMAELAAFADATPFDLPGVVEASKSLQVATNGALATGKGLEMVGDSAVIAGRGYAEMARWIGQVYTGAQQGGQWGEGLEQLTQLAAITPQVKQKIMAMKDAGADFASIWAVAEADLGRFAGAMKMQAGTWNALMTTFGDTVSSVMTQFGKPIMDALKPYLEGATAKLVSFKAEAAAIGEKIGNAIRIVQAAFEGGQLMQLAGDALKLGFSDAVNILVKGVQAAISGIRAALDASGLTSFLASMFEGAGMKLAAVMKTVMADFADTVLRFDQAAKFRAEATVLSAAGDGMFSSGSRSFNKGPAEIGTAALDAFKETFASFPELIPTEDMREKFNSTLSGLQETAAKNKAAQEAKFAAIAAAVVKPQTPGGAPADAAARSSGGGSGATPADRLAQIGGYVGNSANSLADKAANQTAKFTERTANLMERLIALTERNEGLVFN